MQTFQFLDNGLKVSIDWISFTVTNDASVDAVLSFLGYSREDFGQPSNGAQGYKSSLHLNGHSISVLYDGNDNMGIHVKVSGSAIAELIRSFKETLAVDTPFGPGYEIDFDVSVMQAFFSAVLKIGHFARIDLAVDDIGSSFFTTGDLDELWAQKRIVTPFLTIRNDVSRNSHNVETGHTVYFGSRRSEVFLRVYDKRLEQNAKLERAGKELISTPWVRWELECKGSRADSVAKLLVNGSELGSVIVGVLSRYFRVIQLDKSNRTRCSLDERWASFIDGISPLRLSVPEREKTLDDKRVWIERQVAPTLAALILKDGGSMDFLEHCLHIGIPRIKKSLYQLIEREWDALSSSGGDFHGDAQICP